MPEIHVAFFRWTWRKPSTVLISLFSRCQYTHAILYLDGELKHGIHSTAYRGAVHHAEPLCSYDRSVTVVKIGSSSSQAIADMEHALLGIGYDYRGLLEWWRGGGIRSRLYCFELVWDGLKRLGFNLGERGEKISGCELLKILLKYGAEIVHDGEPGRCRSSK